MRLAIAALRAVVSSRSFLFRYEARQAPGAIRCSLDPTSFFQASSRPGEAVFELGAFAVAMADRKQLVAQIELSGNLRPDVVVRGNPPESRERLCYGFFKLFLRG